LIEMAPLQGIRILDFTELLPGPFLSQNLLEMGATVIKVERPPHGDNARLMAPGVFQAANRGKKSIQIDLKSAQGLEQIEQLLLTADMVLEAYRPGVMKRLGLDYASLSIRFPKLIYASLSGYGQAGARALWPGHDLNYQAGSGALALSGLPDGRPEHVFGPPVAGGRDGRCFLRRPENPVYHRPTHHLDENKTNLPTATPAPPSALLGSPAE